MTEELQIRRVPMATKALGVAGIAALTLTACAPDHDDPEDSAQEDVDPEGAEDQGDEPEEIAEEPEDEPEEPESDDEAPELEEIESQMWDTMDEAESVVLDVELPAEQAEVEGPEEFEAEDGETLTQHYSGQVDGSGLTLRQEVGGESSEIITFGDATYVRGEDELRAVAEQHPGEIDEDELAEELEGRWVDYSEIYPDGLTIADEMEELRDTVEDGGLDGLEGEAETRDGEDVWTYTDERRELVVLAGEEPVLISVRVEDDEEVLEARFSEWDEAEEPERPDDEAILTMDDLEELLS